MGKQKKTDRIEERDMLRRQVDKLQVENTMLQNTLQSWQQQKVHLEFVFDSMDDIIFLLDTEQKHTEVFGSWVEKTGLKADHFIGKTAAEVLGAEVAAAHEQANLQALRGEHVIYEWSVPDENSEVLYYQIALSPLWADGKVIGLVGVGRDITKRVLAEQALRDSEERYRSVVTAMREGIVMQQRGGEIVACNSAAEQILGLTQEQMMGRTSVDPRWRAIHEDHSPFPGESHPAMVTLKTGRPQSGVIMGVHKPDGRLTWISINSEPLYRPDEATPYAVVATFVDITYQKTVAAEKDKLIGELQEALRQVKKLSGLLPICASCKKIRNDQGYWQQVEVYLHEHSEAQFTHGICPDCMDRLYPTLPGE